MDSSAAERATVAAATCAVIVPALNEAETVAAVVRPALESGLGRVLVVDDGSTDGTAETARAAGAEVLSLPRNLGKGGALDAAARHLDSDVVVLLDADLTDLTGAHVRALAAPVLAGEADMTRGVFVDGRRSTDAAQRLAPQLNGQRALLRNRLLDVPGLAQSRYGVEVAITRAANRYGWRWIEVPLPGVSQVMKEEKRGWWQGVADRLRMYGEIVTTLFGRRP